MGLWGGPLWRTPRSGSTPARLARVAALAAAFLFVGPFPAQAAPATGAAPSTLLLHAEIPQALDFASQTARQRGWSVSPGGPAALTFEQSIDADGAAAVLRIAAAFAESPAGVTVALTAQEVRTAEDGTTQTQDVTQRYRDNLFNALDALATKWGLRPAATRPVSAPRAPPSPQPPSTATAAPAPAPVPAPMPVRPTPSPAAPPPAPVAQPSPHVAPNPRAPSPPPQADSPRERVGTWAYYAERYAEEHGCALSDRGAVLEGGAAGTSELHRVYCTDGAQLLVRCQAGACSPGR